MSQPDNFQFCPICGYGRWNNLKNYHDNEFNYYIYNCDGCTNDDSFCFYLQENLINNECFVKHIVLQVDKYCLDISYVFPKQTAILIKSSAGYKGEFIKKIVDIDWNTATKEYLLNKIKLYLLLS